MPSATTWVDKYDLAMQEFSDYLKYFPKTDFAPNAQYYIADIYYRKGDYENALPAFDAVLEQYTDSSKTPDAHFMKGMSYSKWASATRPLANSAMCMRSIRHLGNCGASQGPVEVARALRGNNIEAQTKLSNPASRIRFTITPILLRCIDYAVTRSELSEADVARGCELAKQHGVAA